MVTDIASSLQIVKGTKSNIQHGEANSGAKLDRQLSSSVGAYAISSWFYEVYSMINQLAAIIFSRTFTLICILYRGLAFARRYQNFRMVAISEFGTSILNVGFRMVTLFDFKTIENGFLSLFAYLNFNTFPPLSLEETIRQVGKYWNTTGSFLGLVMESSLVEMVELRRDFDIASS